MEVLGDKIIMELNDTAKNGDVETAWDSSGVGAEIEYVRAVNEGRKFLLHKYGGCAHYPEYPPFVR